MSWLKKRKHKSYMRVKHKATHLKHLRHWFDSYDQDKSGSISVSELAWPMLVLGYANTLDEVHKLLHEVDLNGDGTLSFDEFVDLLSQSDAKNVVHPLEKLVQMAQHGDLGVTLSVLVYIDAALSLQTLIPSYQRKLMLESLMAYGDTTHSPRTRRELEVREANEAMLRRADIALHALDTSSAITKPARLPPMTVTTRLKKVPPPPTTRILQAGATLRRKLAATEGPTSLFYESIEKASELPPEYHHRND
ncbi:hypothetical protein AaE_012235 [Aphanomyces astaci]|uniref:EF-hand domain-containing protein n=1 Tax=Aphanomyces astaci TaxID=112090 RepID=A0A6A4ZGZ8_APHAT|nr:hypothetical protein AaE_012235 [Aphanomyces astaci]